MRRGSAAARACKDARPGCKGGQTGCVDNESLTTSEGAWALLLQLQRPHVANVRELPNLHLTASDPLSDLTRTQA